MNQRIPEEKAMHSAAHFLMLGYLINTHIVRILDLASTLQDLSVDTSFA